MAERAAIQWARDTAADLLMPLGQRWAHTVGVVEQARSFAGVLPESEFDVLVAAAYLHDVSYAPELAGTGFHPVDGARFLRHVGAGVSHVSWRITRVRGRGRKSAACSHGWRAFRRRSPCSPARSRSAISRPRPSVRE